MIWRVDEEINWTGQRRRYREAPKPSRSSGGKGSFADQTKGGTAPTNGGKTASKSGGSAKTSDSSQHGDPSKLKNAASQGVDAGLKATEKAAGGSGTASGEAVRLAETLKKAKQTADTKGKGAAAADVAAAGTRAAVTTAADGTVVGAPIAKAVLAAWDSGKKALSYVGIKVEDRYAIYIIGFMLLLCILPIVVFFLVIFFAWDNPRAILSLGWAGVKAFVGGVTALSLINHGGASKLAYEVDVKPGLPTAIAAPIATAPAPDTYEYKLSQIDWEKAKYQTLPNDSRCVIKTKLVKSTIDGKERSVIDSIQLKKNPGKELEGTARANCINNTYPIFQTIMRSQFIRDGLNKNLNVRYAYAEPTDSDNLKKSPEELQKALREKTLTRIWSRGTSYKPVSNGAPDALAAAQKLIQERFDDTRQVRVYTTGRYDQTIVDCANNYLPQGPNLYDMTVDKMSNDLKCGIEPKDLVLWTTMPDESTVNDPNPDLAIRPKRAALNVVCDLKEKLLEPTDQAMNTYRERVKNRINSAAVASWQAVTYADTNRARFLNINELNKDFYKIAGMQSGQEYNHTLDGKLAGTPLEPDAISRIQGYYNKTASDNRSVFQPDQDYINGLNLIFTYIGTPGPKGVSPCVAAQDRANYGDQASIDSINRFWNDVYPGFKKAIAGLDYYTRPASSTSISQIYKNLTYEDIFFRIIRLESNTATAGTEDGPQNFNRMNFGMKAYMNAASLAMGGKFLTQNQAVVRDESVEVARQYEEQSRGLAYRLFNLDNPGSLTSRLRVAFTDKPQHVAGNVASVMANMVNPVTNLAGQRGTLSAILTGKSRVAMAASVYDSQNLKLDPAGTPEIFTQIDPVQNARFIEGLKKQRPDLLQKFFFYELCYREFIPSRVHLLYPAADKKELYDKYCKPLFDSTNQSDQASLNSVETRYAAYHFYNLQADALVYLSNPDQEDISLDAISSLQSNEGPNTDPGTPTGTGTPGAITGLISPPNLGSAQSNGAYRMPASVDNSYQLYSSAAKQCGSLTLINEIYTVAQQFSKTYPGGYLMVGPLNAPGHRSHRLGIDVDLYARVGPEFIADYTKGNYSREKTIALGKMFVDTKIVQFIFYNDTAVQQAVNAYAAQVGDTGFTMQSSSGHENHFHVRINPSYSLPTSEGCTG